MISTSITHRSDDAPLCDSCGLHPANHFICEIINGVTTNRSLCAPCAEAQGATIDAGGVSFQDARCFYCGSQPAGSSMNQAWELPSRKQAMHYTCFRCMGLYHQYLLEALGSISDRLSPEDQLQRMEAMVEEVDSRVRSAISG